MHRGTTPLAAAPALARTACWEMQFLRLLPLEAAVSVLRLRFSEGPGGSVGCRLRGRTQPVSMVHAFLIQTLRCRPGEEAGYCRVLYSRFFGPEGLEDAGRQDREKEWLRRKEQILAVARQVESVCKLHQQASGKPLLEQLTQLPDEPVSLQDAPSGVFRLPPGDPFSEDKTVLWVGVQCLAFALVCDPHENLMLAESTLKHLAKTLVDHLKLLSSGSDVLLKADRTEVILHKFLPHGQLFFLNDQFVLGLEREASAALCK